MVKKTAMKNDLNKAPMHLLDRSAMQAMAHSLGHGQGKYGPDNWRHGIEYTRLISAAMRHMFAIADGEDLDQESGELHAAHAMCNMMFLIWMMRNRPDLDDRFPILFDETSPEVQAELNAMAEVEAQKMEDEIKWMASKLSPVKTVAE
jgi:hypothetical protein